MNHQVFRKTAANRLSTDQLSKQSAFHISAHKSVGLKDVLKLVDRRLQVAHKNHLGYPYNLAGKSSIPSHFGNYLVNNLGDPEAGSHYASEVCDLEREAVHWLMDLWRCDNHDRFWGSVGASGTEGNLWALYLARESLPGGVLIYSDEAHYSIPKAARILGMDSQSVRCHSSGEIDVEALAQSLKVVGTRPIILALTCGTTVKGAHDDIVAAVKALEDAGVNADRRYVHVDGALNAMVLPFITDCPESIRPSFEHEIDSISTSGHKMIGTAMPCGVLIARREHVKRVASSIAYLRSNDTTLMGSRNGHAVLAIWARLLGHGLSGFKQDVDQCMQRTDQMVNVLRIGSVPVLRNPYSMTVVFPQPSEEIVLRYQLACHRGEAHAIVMPSVTDELIDTFVGDYLNWWSHR